MTDIRSITPNIAHGVRPSIAGQIRDALRAADQGQARRREADEATDVHTEIIAALTHGPIRAFDLGSTVMVTAAGVEGRVWLRADGRTWSLALVDAAVLALLLRLEAGLRCGPLVADACGLAIRQASAKVDAIHAWRVGSGGPGADERATSNLSGRIRPVDGDEG